MPLISVVIYRSVWYLAYHSMMTMVDAKWQYELAFHSTVTSIIVEGKGRGNCRAFGKLTFTFTSEEPRHVYHRTEPLRRKSLSHMCQVWLKSKRHIGQRRHGLRESKSFFDIRHSHVKPNSGQKHYLITVIFTDRSAYSSGHLTLLTEYEYAYTDQSRPSLSQLSIRLRP